MATPRDGIYVHPSWLARFMGGEITCEWQVWFKAHHMYEKVPSDFDVASYKVDHTRALRELRGERERDGERVTVERQNTFRWMRPGSSLIIHGTPDLIAVGDEMITVYDVKTGAARDWHPLQVMIYMHCLRQEAPIYRERLLQGVVAYGDDQVAVPPTAIDAAFEENFNYFLDLIDTDEPPAMTPSEAECAWCDIPSSECPDRIEPADGGDEQ